MQRLPVRIDLIDYDPDKDPLFVGLSVVPHVYYKETPTGPDAGKLLQMVTRCRSSTRTSFDESGPARFATCGGQRQRRRGKAGTPTSRPVTSLALAPARSATINPWVVAAAVVIPTFMEVLDTTIANVALRYIAGGLSAAVIDSEWVITSYLAANAIILPISRLALGAAGPTQLLHDFDRHLHDRLGPVRSGHQPEPVDRFSRAAGAGRRRAAALSSQGVLLEPFRRRSREPP